MSWLILAGAAHAASVTAYDLQRPEGARHVLVGLPEGNRPGKHPLIILLHGHGGTASQLLGLKGSAAPLSVWLKIADREGWVVAAPHGLDGSDGMAGWNDCRKDAASNPQADDVGLIGAIIDREVATDNVDPDRVFVMGMSNGAMMTFRAAVELGDRLAGFATVSGSMAKVSECAAPKTPLSGLIISGTADPIVPYGGGDVRILGMPRGSVIPVEQSVKNWRIFDGLPAQAVSVSSLSHHGGDPTSVTRTVWGNDPAGLQVEFLRIDGGGHVEPSPSQRINGLYGLVVGRQNDDVETAEEAFAFFKDKHRAH
ncbi:MAG: PHB depolymerase family esterase [Asticcacaulis sp.]